MKKELSGKPLFPKRQKITESLRNADILGTGLVLSVLLATAYFVMEFFSGKAEMVGPAGLGALLLLSLLSK